MPPLARRVPGAAGAGPAEPRPRTPRRLSDEDAEFETAPLPTVAVPGAITGAGHGGARTAAVADPGGAATPPPPARQARRLRGFRGAALLAAAALLLAAAWLGIFRSSHGTTDVSADSPATTVPRARGVIRATAAAWVARQVSPDATVSCDPATCAVLKAHGVRDLLVLQPGAAGPAGSIVVATAAVRSEFGSRLVAGYAPALLASFGSGTARIDVRQAEPEGPAWYRAALRADLQQRKTFEGELLDSFQIVPSVHAIGQLDAGQVDARLGTLIEGMASELPQPVRILSFGDRGPGAGAGIPLRSATLVGSLATLRAARAFALAQAGAYHPDHTAMTGRGGRHVLIVAFTAPIPLGLLSPASP
jgi:hypothetical protein